MTLLSRISGTLYHSIILRGRWLSSLPVLLLLYDFACFPTFAVHQLAKNVDIVSLVSTRFSPLGIYNTHSISVSVDSIMQKNFLDYVKSSPNAIVITLFIDRESFQTNKGLLGRALQTKLENVFPDASRTFQDQLGRLAGWQPGDVAKLDVHIPGEHYRDLPIDHVYVLVLNKGSGDSNKELLAKGMGSLFEHAARDHIDTLIIPCLGYRWDDKNSLDFNEFFCPLLAALPIGSQPRCIDLSIYDGWPTFTLEEAVQSFNYCWNGVVTGSAQRQFFGIYRADYRGTLLFLAVCLLVSSFYIPLTIKNFLIICGSFVVTTTGAIKASDFVTEGHGVMFRSLIVIVIWIFLATCFPFLASWNPKNIFTKRSGDRE
jgi:hypothetical protein